MIERVGRSLAIPRVYRGERHFGVRHLSRRRMIMTDTHLVEHYGHMPTQWLTNSMQAEAEVLAHIWNAADRVAERVLEGPQLYNYWRGCVQP